MCINLGLDNYQDKFDNLLNDILRHIGESEVSDDEIWHVAREWAEIPHIGNIYLDLMCEKIKSWCNDNGHEFSSYINALDSHIFIKGEGIHSIEDFIVAVEGKKSDIDRVINASKFSVNEIPDQDGMYCWTGCDISYPSEDEAKEALYQHIVNEVADSCKITADDFNDMDIESKVSRVEDFFFPPF